TIYTVLPALRDAGRARVGHDVVTHFGLVHQVVAVRGPGDLLQARRVVHVQGLGPRLAAVARAEHAAASALAVDVSLGRDHHEVGIARIDQDRWDLPGGVEAEMLPRLAGVDRLVDAVAFVDAAARDQVAHTDVDHVGVGGSDFDGADRGRCRDRVEDRGPDFAGAGGFPDAA